MIRNHNKLRWLECPRGQEFHVGIQSHGPRRRDNVHDVSSFPILYHTYFICQVAVPDGIEPPSWLSESPVIPLYQGTIIMAGAAGLEPANDRASKAPAIAAMRHPN